MSPAYAARGLRCTMDRLRRLLGELRAVEHFQARALERLAVARDAEAARLDLEVAQGAVFRAMQLVKQLTEQRPNK